MPAELLSLKEKLLSIYIVYKDALDKKRAQREMHKLRKQMFDVQEKIIQRQEFLAKKEI